MGPQCDVSPALELYKGVFDPVPRLVPVFVVFDFPLSIATPENAWLDFPLLETAPYLVGVAAAIADMTRGQPLSHVG